MSETQYVRAGSVSQAIDALKAANGDGVIIAGGVVVSSLLNQRLASPAVLVDITRNGALEVETIHAGIPPEQVRLQTGWTVQVDERTPRTPEPSAEELRALHEVDPDDVRLIEF